MAKRAAQAGQKPAKTCSLPGCTGALRAPGTGLGCTNPECTNYWEKWKKPAAPVDERATMLAAIRARKKTA